MDEDHGTVPFPICSNVPSDIAESSTIIEEGPRICPLCNSIVRLFFINFNEKILMCENTECEFPFGHEDLQFVKEDTDIHCDEEVISIASRTGRGSPTATGSVVSAAAWADIDRINRIYDSEDSQFELQSITETSDKEKMLKKMQREKENEEQLTKNVQNIKELNLALRESDASDHCINNEKWIKNLLNFQEMSGMQLLRQDEIERLKKKELVLGLGELKIDIDPHSDSISSIKIEIANKGKNVDEGK